MMIISQAVGLSRYCSIHSTCYAKVHNIHFLIATIYDMQLKEGLYCYLVPPGFDGTRLMKELWNDCVLPECDRHYERAVEEFLRGGPTELNTGVQIFPMNASASATSSSSSSTSSNTAARPRLIITFDGCWQQLHAVMTSLNAKFTERGYEAFKFAAASTMVEQPNDVGHCHKAIKTYYKGNSYRDSTDWEIPAYLKGFDVTLTEAGMDSGGRKTIFKALCHLEVCLSKVCTIPMVREGFRLSGIYPVNVHAILSGWSGWSLIDKEKAEELVSLLPKLTSIARAKGKVTDGKIEECMGHLIQFGSESRKSDSCAMNHGRCLWTNNETVVEQHQNKVAAEEQKGVDMDNKQMEKEWRIEMPEGAASEDKKVAARAAALVVETDSTTLPAKKARHYRCSNSLCSTSASAVVKRGWKKCQKKGCSQAFCTNCDAILLQHQNICGDSSRNEMV